MDDAEKMNDAEKMDVAEKTLTSEADLSTSGNELDLTAGSLNSSFGLGKNNCSQVVMSTRLVFISSCPIVA